MKNVAIVEDENGAAELLISYVKRYEEETGKTFNVIRFKDAADLLDGYKSVYSVILMDIQMPRSNGMDAATELRKLDKTVSIVFITNLVRYAQRGYEVDAVGFLVKPVNYYDFSMKFSKALDINLMNEERSVTISIPGGLYRISTDKIKYVEIIRHRLYYHLVDDVIEMTGVLAEAEKELSGYGFLRCNNCYLVNPKFIIKVKGSEVDVGGELLQISRARRSAFLSDLANWYAGNGGSR